MEDELAGSELIFAIKSQETFSDMFWFKASVILGANIDLGYTFISSFAKANSRGT